MLVYDETQLINLLFIAQLKRFYEIWYNLQRKNYISRLCEFLALNNILKKKWKFVKNEAVGNPVYYNNYTLEIVIIYIFRDANYSKEFLLATKISIHTNILIKVIFKKKVTNLGGSACLPFINSKFVSGRLVGYRPNLIKLASFLFSYYT